MSLILTMHASTRWKQRVPHLNKAKELAAAHPASKAVINKLNLRSCVEATARLGEGERRDIMVTPGGALLIVSGASVVTVMCLKSAKRRVREERREVRAKERATLA